MPKRVALFKKAPDAPRRFKSAYIYFSTIKHKELREELKCRGEEITTPEVAKLVSAVWKELSEEERLPWEKMALQDKIRFQYEMAHYKGPLKVAKSTRQKKDPGAPKRPVSAFLAYSRAKGDELKKKNPRMHASELAIRLGKMWKADHPSVREHFTKFAEACYENYKAQMALHRQLRFIEKQQKENQSVMKALSERESALEAMKQLDSVPVAAASAVDDEFLREFWEPPPFFEISDVDFDDFLDVEISQPNIGAISPQSVHNARVAQTKEDGPLPTAFLQSCGPILRDAGIVGDARIVTPEQSPRDVFFHPQPLNHAATLCSVTPEKSSTAPTDVYGYMCSSSSSSSSNVDVSLSPPRYMGMNPFFLQHLPPLPNLNCRPMRNYTPPSNFMAESGGNKSMQLSARKPNALLPGSNPHMTAPWKEAY